MRRAGRDRRVAVASYAVCCVALHVLSALLPESLGAFIGLPLLSSKGARESVVSRNAQGQASPILRRESLLLGSALGAGAPLLPAESARAAVQVDPKKTELLRIPANPKTASRPYILEKPAGFKRFASPVDPSGLVFRAFNDSYFAFVTRIEQLPNASSVFTPQSFIDDYRGKFTEASGSAFILIKGGTEPDKVDSTLGVKYYEVEYVLRTQLGFSFDSLKSLHLITIFAAAPEGLYVLNCQALDDKWDTDGPALKRIADSFAIVG